MSVASATRIINEIMGSAVEWINVMKRLTSDFMLTFVRRSRGGEGNQFIFGKREESANPDT